MRTYRELFRAPEFMPLFLASSVQAAAQTMSSLALSTLIYTATGSPLLSALAMFGPSLTQVIGASTWLSASDRLPPRAVMSGLSVAFAAGTAALAMPGMPVWAAFVIVSCLGLGASLAGAVRYGLLNEVVAKEGYLLGRSVLNVSVGAMQICGFAAGGVFVTTLSPRGTLLIGAALYVTGAAVARFGLTRRPPRAAGRPSVPDTWRVNARLWSSTARRYVYIALWVPNGLIVGCESLFIPYAPRHGGLLFVSAAVGMLAGDTLAGRFIPDRWQQRLGALLRVVLAAPYLIFAMRPALPVAVAAVVIASVGYCASLLLQERLMALTPDEVSGQALGLASSGMLAMQGAGAAVAGAVAQLSSPGAAMAVMAAVSLGVTLILAPGLRPAVHDRNAGARAERPGRVKHGERGEPMSKVTFGLSIPASVLPGTDPVASARMAEDLGFDFVSASDHPCGTEPTYETWTMLSWVAAATSRIRVATRVLGVPYRNPAMVAKMAETLSRLSGGRLILGLGGGYSDDEFRAFGLGTFSPRDKVDGLEEAISITRGLWSHPGFTFTGRLHRTDSADLEPKPAHQIPIWLGTFGDRALRVTGQFADGWIPSYGNRPLHQYQAMRQRVLTAAREAGRDPAGITCALHLQAQVGDRVTGGPSLVGGPPGAVTEQLLTFAGIGFTSFSFTLTGPGTREQAERLAHEVIPAVRAASARSGADMLADASSPGSGASCPIREQAP